MSSQIISETRDLFYNLGRAKRLLRSADDTSKASEANIRTAAALVCRHTYDAQWRSYVMSLCYRGTSDPAEPLILDSTAADTDSTPQIRIERARESGDPLVLGNMLVKHGLYREALMAYNKSPEHRLECASHLNILQSNWSMVVANLGKNVDSLTNTLLLNLAYAYWCTQDFGEALAVLLRLDPSLEMHYLWVGDTEVLTMLQIGALLTLSRSALRFFRHSDPVYMHYERLGRPGLIKSYLELDLQGVTEHVSGLRIPEPLEAREGESWSTTVPGGPIRRLRDRILKDWLYVHSKVPLPTALKTFRVLRDDAEPEYTVIDLFTDLRRWNAPYRVDAEAGVLEAYEEAFDNAGAAEDLVRWFKRDALALLWKQEAPDA